MRAEYTKDIVMSDGVWVDARAYGSTLGHAAINAAITDIGTSDEKTLLIAPGAWTIGSNITTTPNITLRIMDGAVLTVTDCTVAINGWAEIGLSKVFVLSGTGVVTFGDQSVTEVRPEWWGAEADDTIGSAANNATAIDAALATEKNVTLLGGTYYTTGNHAILFNAQNVYGNLGAATILKKSTGTNSMFECSYALVDVGIRNIFFDGNSLGGSQIIWRGHRSTLSNIKIRDQGGTDYAIHFSGCNVSNFSNITIFSGCYGGILFDNLLDPDYAAGTPGYSCLYSTFDQLFIYNIVTGNAMKMSGSQVMMLTFVGCVIQHGTAPAPAIYIPNTATNVANITFYDLKMEIGSEIGGLSTNLIEASGVNTTNSTVHSLKFYGGKLTMNFAADAVTNKFFQFTYVDGIIIEGMYFYDLLTGAGRDVIGLTSCSNIRVVGSTCAFSDAFDFITGSGCTKVLEANNTIRENYTGGGGAIGAGTNTWSTITNLVIENSAMAQTFAGVISELSMDGVASRHSQTPAGHVTVADDEYYDVFGDGGSTSPGADFVGIISIGIGTPVSGNEANVAVMYAQCATAANSAQAVSIVSGANIEIDELDNTAAALATTTDAKLGIQVGGGAAAKRFVRIYNRLGSSITLYVHVLRMV